MDYTQYLEMLSNATLFDLFRVQCAINQLLDNPHKQQGIKKHLHPGKEIRYFEAGENKLIDAVILTIKRTRAFVQNKEDGQRWNIPFYMINLEGVDTSVRSRKSSHPLDRAQLSVGDQVGFHSKLGKDLYGSIIKLNPKCAKIKLTTGETWHVAYCLLFSVMDGQYQENEDGTLLIEGSIVKQE